MVEKLSKSVIRRIALMKDVSYADNPSVQLEHSDVWLKCHLESDCKVYEYCTVHKRSDHSMRSFPQHWRSDRGIMERTCPHGIGHPDPDDITNDRAHGCDGCCYAPYKEA